MPQLDKTGPKGEGPKTGRKLGRCQSIENSNNNDISETILGRKRGLGCRNGFGRRRGLGRRNRFVQRRGF